MMTIEQVIALAEAMQQLLDDMGVAGRSVSGLAKAQARVAYEPFREIVEDDGVGCMSMADAEDVLRSVTP